MTCIVIALLSEISSHSEHIASINALLQAHQPVQRMVSTDDLAAALIEALHALGLIGVSDVQQVE